MGLARKFRRPPAEMEQGRLACDRSFGIEAVVRLLATQPSVDRGRSPSFLLQLLFISIAFGGFVTGFSSHQGVAPEPGEGIIPGEGGWVSLFEGGSMRGWEFTDTADWKIVDSVLTGQNGGLLN